MTDISKSKSSAGDEIIRGLTGLRDALATGDPLFGRFAVHTVELDLEPRQWTPAQLRKLRARFQASQSVFAKLIGASVKTVQAWEQGSQPPAMASRLLECIDRFPEPWEDMLRRSAVTTVRRSPPPRPKKKPRTTRINSRHGQAK